MNLNQLKRTAVGLAVASAALAAGSAQAYQMTLNVAGIESRDELGALDAVFAPINETRFLDLFAGARVTGLAWNVSLFTNGVSWLSEISVDFNDGGAAGVSLSPGFGDNDSGAADYTGSADLMALGVDFTVGASGRLFMEFFERFNDFTGVDGVWRSGTLTVTYVPEPASFGLAAIALLGLGATSRRRRQLQG